MDQGELDDLRTTQEETMQDVCRIEYNDRTGPPNSLGLPTKIAVAPLTTVCGFRPGGGREVSNGTERVISDASIRLPESVQIDNLARIVLLKQFGSDIDPLIFGVIGLPRRGPSALVLHLQHQGGS